MKSVKLSESILDHIKSEISQIEEGEIVIDINADKDKVDVQTMYDDPSEVNELISDIKKAVGKIHHGKVIVEIRGENERPIIKTIKRERYIKGNKKTRKND